MTVSGAARQDADFFSNGSRCAAWLFRPAESSEGKPPVIVMAHGFAGERTFRLPAYATKFADRGMAVLVFDYRHFGDSEGEPRNLVDYRLQHRDWQAAIDHARTIDSVDGSRIGLWGSSFSGGHVVSVAADNPSVRAIVSQVPMLNVVRSLRIKAPFLVSALIHGLRDYGRAIIGRSPHYIAMVGPPTQFAALNQQGCEAGYRSMIPPERKWENQCAARSLVTTLLFAPSRKASKVGCPALFIIAQNDQVIRAGVTEKLARKVSQAEVVRYPADHFEIYRGELFEEISNLQADFLAKHLHQ